MQDSLKAVKGRKEMTDDTPMQCMEAEYDQQNPVIPHGQAEKEHLYRLRGR